MVGVSRPGGGWPAVGSPLMGTGARRSLGFVLPLDPTARGHPSQLPHCLPPHSFSVQQAKAGGQGPTGGHAAQRQTWPSCVGRGSQGLGWALGPCASVRAHLRGLDRWLGTQAFSGPLPPPHLPLSPVRHLPDSPQPTGLRFEGTFRTPAPQI